MAASLRQSRMFQAQFCVTAARCGRVKIKLVPVFRLTSRQFSQLHKYTRCVNLQSNGHFSRRSTDALQNVYCISLVRLASTSSQPDIPPPPPSPPSAGSEPYSGFITESGLAPEDIIPNLPDLNALGEPTLRSLGLGSNWPPGLIQKGFEALHVNLDIPWWSTVMIGVLLIRTALFFLMIKQQRYNGHLEKHNDKLKRLQALYDDAKNSQDSLEIMKRGRELQQYTVDNNLRGSMLNTMVPTAVQGIVMCSAFFGLRKMAFLPVFSMTTGGMLWFPDFTIADPYGILSLMAAGGMLATMELGAETMALKRMSTSGRMMMRGATGLVFIFTYWQPSVSVFYLCCNSVVTLCQNAVLQRPAVRERLRLPERSKAKATDKKPGNLSFRKMFENIKDKGYDMVDQRKQKQGIINRRVADDEQFKKAGVGPIPKTYAYNPRDPRFTES